MHGSFCVWCACAFAGVLVPAVLLKLEALVRTQQAEKQSCLPGAYATLHIPDFTFNSSSCLFAVGFFMSYNASALAPNITQAVREMKEEFPNAPLYVAGHSMGAAMAHICALDMKFTLGFETINVYTFGSPRVGNDKFKLYYNKIVNVSYLLFNVCWEPAIPSSQHVAPLSSAYM